MPPTILTYEEQEELVRRLLALFSRLDYTDVAPLFEKQYGLTLTRSNFSRAKQTQTGAKRDKPLSAKQDYIVALFSLAPDLSAATVRAKTKLYFGEDTRADLVESLRGSGGVDPRFKARAQRIIWEVEAQVHQGGTLDLSGETPANIDEVAGA